MKSSLVSIRATALGVVGGRHEVAGGAGRLPVVVDRNGFGVQAEAVEEVGAETAGHIEWLTVCLKLRASGMPLPAIRRHAGFVRQGPGNEQQRLALMREHSERVIAQMAELTECLNLISRKIEVYGASLIGGEACLTREGADAARARVGVGRRYQLSASEAGMNSAAASVPFLRKRSASHSGPGIMWMP